MRKENSWKSLSSNVVYKNDWGRKVREHQVLRPNGENGTYAVFEVPPGVIILPITDQNEIYLIGQYRFPISQYSLELPSGGIDEGEDPLDAAKRELKEETGLEASNWTKLGELCFSTGSSNERSTAFLAQDLTETSHHEQEEEGIDEIRTVSITEFRQLAKEGKIIDASSIATLALAEEYLIS